MRRHPSIAGRDRAFTLVEVLIAITIVAILAAIVVPAISGIDRRKARFDADQLEDLLTMYAYRDSTTSQQIRIERDPQTGAIGLWVKETDPGDPNAIPQWLPDRFTDPVMLDVVTILDVRMDGYRFEPGHWSLTRVPGQPRPRLEIDISGPEIDSTIVLDAQAITPRRLEVGRRNADVRQVIDLDGEGLDREDW